MTTERQHKKEERRRERAVNTAGPPRNPPRPGYDASKMFPDGYPIAVLEGYRKPTDDEVKRTMVGRVTYLIQMIEERTANGRSAKFALMELASIARLIDLLEGRTE